MQIQSWFTGKCNNHNFIILSPLMQQAFKEVISNRALGNILEDNPFIFARGYSKDGFIRHSPVLRAFIEEFGVKNMETRKMRAYLATTFQVTKISYRLKHKENIT